MNTKPKRTMYGPASTRLHLVQPGTSWVPRHEAARQRRDGTITIVTVHRDQDPGNWLITIGQSSRRWRVYTLLRDYRREDEQPQAPAAERIQEQRLRAQRDPLGEAMRLLTASVQVLTGRLEGLEADLATIMTELGVKK